MEDNEDDDDDNEDTEGDDDANPLLVNPDEETDQATKTKLWFGKVREDKIIHYVPNVRGQIARTTLVEELRNPFLIYCYLHSRILQLWFPGNVSRS